MESRSSTWRDIIQELLLPVQQHVSHVWGIQELLHLTESSTTKWENLRSQDFEHCHWLLVRHNTPHIWGL